MAQRKGDVTLKTEAKKMLMKKNNNTEQIPLAAFCKTWKTCHVLHSKTPTYGPSSCKHSTVQTCICVSNHIS